MVEGDQREPAMSPQRRRAFKMSDIYLTGPQVRARYNISEMTLHRWQKDDKLGFSKPMIIRRRKLFKEEDMVQWERQREAGGR
jgi:hypothetical protein